MIVWGIFWGAALGAGFSLLVGGWSIAMGALTGCLVGASLRVAVRREVARATAQALSGAVSAHATTSIPVVSQGLAEPSSADPASAVADTPVVAQPHAVAAAERVPTPKLSMPVSNPQSATPSALEQALAAATQWLVGGNTIVRVGVVILFIGLSFLARYAAASGLLPVEFRLAGIGTVGVALLTFGFGKRLAKPGFALALQGAGVAVLYLTVFAAFRLYELLPALPAFALMALMCGFSCALALLQNSRALAVVAFAGGFAVPILLSSGQGGHVGLFAYYLALNLAILFVAHRRSWRLLNLLGFVATFVVAGAWGALKYVPEHFATTQPFLIGFVLIYVAAAVMYARNTPTRLGNTVDSSLVFGTPLVGFGLQVGLVAHVGMGAAFSALGFAAFYLALATVLVRRSLVNYRLLIECFVAIGLGFATLAVPLALDAKWTSAVWALEGAGAFWVGLRQGRWMPRLFGLVLQAVAALAFMSGSHPVASALPLFNPSVLGAMLIAVPAMLLAWWLRAPAPEGDSRWAKAYLRLEGRLGEPLFLYGFAWWCLALAFEVHRVSPQALAEFQAGLSGDPSVFGLRMRRLLTMMVVVFSAAGFLRLGLRLRWAVATWPSRFSLVALALGAAAQLALDHRVLAWPAWLVWACVWVVHCVMLRANDRDPSPWLQRFNHIVHAGGVWLVVVLLADALWYALGQGDLWRTSWASEVMLFSAIVALLILVVWAGRANHPDAASLARWPLQNHASAYYWTAARPLAAFVFGGALVLACWSSGRTAPLPYLPLLNPTELAICLGLGALVLWRRVLMDAVPQPVEHPWLRTNRAWTALGALGFVFINTVWLRIAHHFFDVEWGQSALFASFVVQTGYAILWSLLALALMLVAHRRCDRTLWLTGAGLLGLVVVKLVLIDLVNAGGVERIVAFIAVGVLMLVVGYCVPLPPKASVPNEPPVKETP